LPAAKAFGTFVPSAPMTTSSQPSRFASPALSTHTPMTAPACSPTQEKSVACVAPETIRAEPVTGPCSADCQMPMPRSSVPSLSMSPRPATPLPRPSKACWPSMWNSCEASRPE
jgi:hypothetical protein